MFRDNDPFLGTIMKISKRRREGIEKLYEDLKTVAQNGIDALAALLARKDDATLSEFLSIDQYKLSVAEIDNYRRLAKISVLEAYANHDPMDVLQFAAELSRDTSHYDDDRLEEFRARIIVHLMWLSCRDDKTKVLD